jgi:trans-aconitate methyltransferase
MIPEHATKLIHHLNQAIQPKLSAAIDMSNKIVLPTFALMESTAIKWNSVGVFTRDLSKLDTDLHWQKARLIGI